MINEVAMTETLEGLREKLPIPYVMEHYGHHPAEESPGRLHYHNPFREDNNPSFDVFINDAGVQRWGDYAARQQGSVLDLILHFEGKTEFKSILTVAREIYANYLASDWKWPEGFEGGKKKHADPEDIKRLYDTASNMITTHPVYEDLMAKTALSHEALEGWGIRAMGDKLVFPYPGFVHLKYRWPDGSKSGIKGGQSVLYHKSDVIDTSKPIILVEGETDTIAATHYAGDEYQVVGVPGVGSQPMKHGPMLQDADSIIIFFDGDDAGREGAKAWHLWLQSYCKDVQVVPTPEGMDICDLTEAEFWRCIAQRRGTVTSIYDLEDLGWGYGYPAQSDKQKDKYVSDWVFKVNAIIHTPEGNGYEGDLYQTGQLIESNIILGVEDLSTHTRLAKWAQRHRVSWAGGAGSNHKLNNLLASKSGAAFVIAGTTRPGLEGATFTYPGNYIGNTEVRTLPSRDNPLSLPESYNFEDIGTVQARKILGDLLAMYDPEYIVPILSWYAIAPLRSKYRQFPMLSVSGMAGSGKTTVVHYVQSKFAGITFETNLTTTSPYAVSKLVGASTAYPVWFDEYRRGGDQKAMERLGQLMRDAYTATPSSRGGMTENYSEVSILPTDAPLVISGESYADEQSHRDRLIKVFLKPSAKGDQPRNEGSLAQHYLNYLLNPSQYGRSYVENPPKIVPLEWDGLSDRQKYNLGVIQAGYSLLADYAWDMGMSVPELKLDVLIAEMVEETQEDQVIEALIDVFESHFNSDNGAVEIENGKTYVHSSSVMQVADRMGIVLPFTTGNQLSRYLSANHGATDMTKVGGPSMKNRRVWVIHRDIRKADNGDS